MSSRPKPPVTGAPGLAGDRCYKLGPWCAPGVSLQGKAIMGNQRGPSLCWLCCLPATTRERKPSQALSNFFFFCEHSLAYWGQFPLRAHMKVHTGSSVFVSTGDTHRIFFYYYLCVHVCLCLPREKWRNDLTFQETLSRKLQKIKQSTENQNYWEMFLVIFEQSMQLEQN